MAESNKGGSGLYSNPPVGDLARLGTPGPLDALKGQSMVKPTGAAPTNDFDKIKSPAVVKR